MATGHKRPGYRPSTAVVKEETKSRQAKGGKIVTTDDDDATGQRQQQRNSRQAKGQGKIVTTDDDDDDDATGETQQRQQQRHGNLKTDEMHEGIEGVANSPYNRKNLPPELKQQRGKAEHLKRDAAPQWKNLSDEKKIAWWDEFINLLDGETSLENKLMKLDLQQIEKHYETEWEASKECQGSELGKCHTKNSSIIFALDKCFEAHNNGYIIYFFKFTESPDSSHKVKYTGSDPVLGENYLVGIATREHTAHVQSNSRTPSICVYTGEGKGRRFGVYEMPELGQKYDPTKHLLGYSVDVLGLFDGDPGSYYHEFVTTFVGRFFFQDYACVNRSYTGAIMESADPNAKQYKKNRKTSGCGAISFHVGNLDRLAFDRTYMKFDKSKGSEPWLASCDVKVVTCAPTTKTQRKLRKSIGVFEDVEETYENTSSMNEYRWNFMADLLSEYATEHNWKRGEANVVEKEHCTGKYGNESLLGRRKEVTPRSEPYFYVWFLTQIGLRQKSNQAILTDLQTERLKDIGVSFTNETREKVTKSAAEKLEKAIPQQTNFGMLGDMLNSGLKK